MQESYKRSSPKNENSVIIYSPSYCSKTVCCTFVPIECKSEQNVQNIYSALGE